MSEPNVPVSFEADEHDRDLEPHPQSYSAFAEFIFPSAIVGHFIDLQDTNFWANVHNGWGRPEEGATNEQVQAFDRLLEYLRDLPVGKQWRSLLSAEEAQLADTIGAFVLGTAKPRPEGLWHETDDSGQYIKMRMQWFQIYLCMATSLVLAARHAVMPETERPDDGLPF